MDLGYRPGVNGSHDPAQGTLEVGRLVDGRYRLEAVAGVGGMAIVYRAWDTKAERLVAIKLLRREVLDDRDLAMRFRREALAATVLRHPNIIACLEAGTDDGQPYLVMDLIEGEDLAARLRRDGRLSADETARIGLDVARALGVAHIRGIVHRDVKPGNIVLARDGRAMITDFGIARLAADAEGTVPGTTLGSVHYFSPEQAVGQTTTPASDIYGLGLVLYETLVGRRAWAGASTAEIASARVGSRAPSARAARPDVPAALDAIVVRALATDPADRFPNGNAMATALEPLAVRIEPGELRLDPAGPTIAVATAPPVVPGVRAAPDTGAARDAPVAPRRPAPLPVRRAPAAIAAPLAVLGIVAVVVAGALLIAALPGPGGSSGIALTSPSAATRTAKASRLETNEPPASVAATNTQDPTDSPIPTPRPRGNVADLCDPLFGFACGVGAGKVESSVFQPPIRLTLGDGWSVAGVAPQRMSLARPEGTMTFSSGIDATYAAGEERSAPTTARGLVEAFIGTAGVAAEAPSERTVGEQPAISLALTPIGRDRVALFRTADQTFFLAPGGPTRVIAVDGPRGPLVIAIEASPDTTMRSMLPVAQTVLKTLRFR